jgi:hypothetical protein
MSAEWLAFGGILGVLVLFWAVIPVWRGGALWVPTYEPVVRRMLTLADVKPGETVELDVPVTIRLGKRFVRVVPT